MRIVIAAPSNGSVLKDALAAQLRDDARVTELVDISRDASYPALSFEAAEGIAAGRYDRGILICGTGVGTAIAASKVPGVRAGTAHDIVTARGAVENYDAQILCMGQNVIAAPHARALVDVWLDARHDPASAYGAKLTEIAEYESGR